MNAKQRLVYGFLTFLNRIVPKKNMVFINAEGCLYDNNEAVFDYLNRNTVFPVVCMGDVHLDFQLRENVKFVKFTHLNEIRYLLTSRVAIDCLFRRYKIKPRKGQLFIQMWHGSPFKGSGNALDDYSEYISVFSYPAPMFEPVYQKVFGMDPEHLLINGNARNDYLYDPDYDNPILKKGMKNIIWMPTYRHRAKQSDTTENIPVIRENNVDDLNRCLAENNVHLFIKPHPLQADELMNFFTAKSNISILTDAMVRETNVPLYRFLGATDALLTDYSSVFYDYLLLDKPIGFVIGDIEEYGSKRGFVFENPLDYMPGEKIFDMDGIKKFITDLGNSDNFRADRKRVNELANFYRDGQNCKRWADLISKAVR